MGNSLAQLMILGWPLVVVVLFQRLPVPKALVISIVAGYLVLPTEPVFNLPLLPTWNKALAASLPALLMAIIKSRPTALNPRPAHVLDGWLPRVPILIACIAAIVIGPIFTVLTNSDAQVYPMRTLTGLRPYDAGSMVLTTLCALIPFFLARKYLTRPRDQIMLLAVLCVAGLIYTLPALWEVRMSPRLNSQIYGFFPHDWRQHVRGGGYRPLVFLEHGLKLGLFFSLALLATLGYRRLGPPVLQGPLVLAAIWLFGTLFLAKTLGAFLIAVVLAPVILLLGSRLQLLTAGVIAGMVLVFPMIRSADLVPTGTILNVIGTFAEDSRVRSLDFRFRTEDTLLEKAEERPLFGWGGWGRSRVYDERGRDLVDTDGGWILAFGERGWTGYLGRFGLLTLPVIILAVRRRRTDYPMATSVTAVVLVGNLVDLIPNTGLTPITWLLAGTLVARIEAETADEPEAAAAEAAPASRGPAYRRDLGGAAKHGPEPRAPAPERPAKPERPARPERPEKPERTPGLARYRRDLTPKYRPR